MLKTTAHLLKTIGLACKMSPKKAHDVLKRSQNPLPDLQVAKTEFGTFCGLANDYLFQSAVAQGSNEPHFDEVIAQLVDEDAIVLDVGANIGTHTILLSKKARSGHVHAFEPQSLVFSILQNNILLNECQNVSPYRFAVSNEDNTVLTMEPFSFAGARINNGAIRVDKQNTLGDLTLSRRLDSWGFEKVDFIKMDIQGSEVAALEGAEALIVKHRPTLFVEIEEQHLRKLGASAKALIEKIMAFDYALYRIENAYPCDHICIPLEKVEAFEASIVPQFTFTLSQKIAGRKVELEFNDPKDQNYSNLTIVA